MTQKKKAGIKGEKSQFKLSNANRLKEREKDEREGEKVISGRFVSRLLGCWLVAWAETRVSCEEGKETFLVASTRLYTLLCRSVRPSVGWSLFTFSSQIRSF